MKFSLRTFLITVAALGAFLGIMIKLFLEKPRAFSAVIDLIATVVPFLLAIGTIAWLGFRRKSLRSLPVCAGCKHELRSVDSDSEPRCPACGFDLAQPGAVLFVNHRQRRWALLAWAGVLFLMPPAVALVHLIEDLRVLTTQQLIQNRLPNQIEEPRVWGVLEERMNRGDLSQDEVDDALHELISYMKSHRPKGWNAPLTWQQDFLDGARRAHLISDDVLREWCDAFFGPGPTANPPILVREDSTGFNFGVSYGTPWATSTGVGVKLLWNVKSVQLDQRSVTVRQLLRTDEHWSGQYDGELKAGEHQIAVEIDCAYVPLSSLTGVNATSLASGQWPKGLKRWTATLIVPFTVTPVATD